MTKIRQAKAQEKTMENMNEQPQTQNPPKRKHDTSSDEEEIFDKKQRTGDGTPNSAESTMLTDLAQEPVIEPNNNQQKEPMGTVSAQEPYSPPEVEKSSEKDVPVIPPQVPATTLQIEVTEKIHKQVKKNDKQFSFDKAMHLFEPSEVETLYNFERTDKRFRVMVKMINGAAINGMLFGRTLRQLKVGKIDECRRVSRNSICVIFKNRQEANSFVKNQTELNNRGLQAEIPLFYRTCVGVIKGIPVDISAQEIFEELSEQNLNVLKVERMTRRLKDGHRDYSLNVKVFFGREKLPASVDIFYMKERVHEYIPPVLLCMSCFRYGHSTQSCKSSHDSRKCSRCGSKQHQRQSCDSPHPICIHCKGSHEATAKICPERKRNENIKILMTRNNVTYQEVLEAFPTYTDRNQFALLENLGDFPTLKRASYSNVVKGRKQKIVSAPNKKKSTTAPWQPEKYSSYYAGLTIDTDPAQTAFGFMQQNDTENTLDTSTDSVQTVVEGPTSTPTNLVQERLVSAAGMQREKSNRLSIEKDAKKHGSQS